jgi:hypothetical protein
MASHSLSLSPTNQLLKYLTAIWSRTAYGKGQMAFCWNPNLKLLPLFLACLCMEWNYEWQCSLKYNIWHLHAYVFGIFEPSCSFYKYIFETVKNIINSLCNLYNEMGRMLKKVFHFSFYLPAGGGPGIINQGHTNKMKTIFKDTNSNIALTLYWFMFVLSLHQLQNILVCVCVCVYIYIYIYKGGDL